MASDAAATKAQTFDRPAVESLLARRFFITPSFEIYGGVAGLYDFGPPGTALLNNFQQLWRQHFVLQEEMHELDLTVVTPHPVLKTSGHVDRFCDWMVTDTVNGNISRADHLVKNTLQERLDTNIVKLLASSASGNTKAAAQHKTRPLAAGERETYENLLARLNDFSGADLGNIIREHGILSPVGNPVNEPVEFNLMFDVAIGPKRDIKGFLRPETAQGQFVNFAKLLEFNNQRMPFASASIGRSFRNEISPRSGLLRVREFLMAEIEHFVDPDNKAHAKFDEIRDVELDLLAAATQSAGSTSTRRMRVGDAVAQGVINNETLGYFLARTHQFLELLGIRRENLRFRQHMASEMAHYACDCWDAELLCSYGWIECVGCADRSAFDLTRHSEATSRRLVVREQLPKPRERLALRVDRKKFGPKFKAAAKSLESALDKLTQDALENMRTELAQSGRVSFTSGDCCAAGGAATSTTVELTPELVRVETVVENVREYVPNVIEPSFGIGRILYCLLEQAFHMRTTTEGGATTAAATTAAAAAAASTEEKSEDRAVLRLAASIAPYKLLVAPLSNNPEFHPIVRDIANRARRAGLPTRVDDSGVSIGRRYARSDELGTPFAVTVDFESAKEQTITLRERDSMRQLRVKVSEVVQVVASLCDGSMTWEEASASYPINSLN